MFLSEQSSYSVEHFLDVAACFGRSLVVHQSLVLHELVDFLCRYLSSGVVFVAYQHQSSIGVSVALDLIDPVIFDVLEGVSDGQIKY